MNGLVRPLFVICAWAIAQASAQSPPAPSSPSTATPDTSATPDTPTRPDAASSSDKQPAIQQREPGSTPPVQSLPGQSPAAADSKRINRVVVVDNGVTEDQLRQILAKGYKPQAGPGNQAVYCRREAEIGTRFKTTVCKTSALILQEEQQGKDITTRAQKDNGNMAH